MGERCDQASGAAATNGSPGVVEDDKVLLVLHARGATTTCHLTANSPREGYRGMSDGSAGPLEPEVEESRRRAPRTRVTRGPRPRRPRCRNASHGQAVGRDGAEELYGRPQLRERQLQAR
ncbi:hypothetical protein ACFZBZ_13180 [Streptomyces sp. NPDC008196]|uniref:hypothetical protein n=1 Tax=Streptomyces sp. NPDC008196 TaxID=3364819 RepID=UPI0036E37933